MYYYSLDNNVLISESEYNGLIPISEQEARGAGMPVFLLNRLDPLASRRKFCVSDPSLAFIKDEGIELICKQTAPGKQLPQWLVDMINHRKIASVNTLYPGWYKALSEELPSKWRINVVGLGDVGGMLVAGLRLLGGDCIEAIGIFDIDHNKVARWEFEANQISSPDSGQKMPPVVPLTEEQLFDCDMFVFCVTVGVPPLGETRDVRIAQFEGNSLIVSLYAKKARQKNFGGIFAVVSDPVDLLCKSAFLYSNIGENGNMDFKGLASDRIIGYGLGVMHARALYYSDTDPELCRYREQGRAFGPHGEGLIIADSLIDYNNELSLRLTEKACKANMAVRDTGFKPYIAPALSSGALSIISTIKGQWHYSTTYMGGVYWGSRNRLLPSGVELERFEPDAVLYSRIKESYERLGAAL